MLALLTTPVKKIILYSTVKVDSMTAVAVTFPLTDTVKPMAMLNELTQLFSHTIPACLKFSFYQKYRRQPPQSPLSGGRLI